MWNRIKKFFLYSESIFLARLTILIGSLLQATATVDPNLFATLVGNKWLPVILIAHGALGEFLRRRRDEDLKKRGR